MRTAREQVENNMRQLMAALEQERSKGAAATSKVRKRGEHAPAIRTHRHFSTLCRAQLTAVQGELAECRQQLEALRRREKELEAEVARRQQVDSELEKVRAEIAALKVQLKEVRLFCSPYLCCASHKLFPRPAQRDETLIELAGELGKTRVTVDTLEEFKTSVKTSEWVDDSQVNNCMGCSSAFSVTLRKVRSSLIARPVFFRTLMPLSLPARSTTAAIVVASFAGSARSAGSSCRPLARPSACATAAGPALSPSARHKDLAHRFCPPSICTAIHFCKPITLVNANDVTLMDPVLCASTSLPQRRQSAYDVACSHTAQLARPGQSLAK